MIDRILTLRRKRNETSEIRIDISVKYAGSLSKPDDAVNSYALGDGISENGISRTITILYEEDVNNRGELTILEDGVLIDSIVIEDSDVDSIVIEDSDTDFIVIEDSNVATTRIVTIKIPSLIDDYDMTSRVGTAIAAQ